jgi:hypothetical protein
LSCAPAEGVAISWHCRSFADAEEQRPLATVIIGGIITSAFLTLGLLPVLYEWIETRRRGTTSVNLVATFAHNGV